VEDRQPAMASQEPAVDREAGPREAALPAEASAEDAVEDVAVR
jgi:hypothetical protein